MRTMTRASGPRAVDLALARLRPELPGLLAAAFAVALVLALSDPLGGQGTTGREAYCYWLPALSNMYALSDWTSPVAYVYSPAFLQVLAPLKALPWQAFLGLWTALLLLAIRFLSGPRLWAAAIAFATFELVGGNTHLLLAGAIVVGFRWPAAWALVLLTKVTPGVGLLWFAFRGEWRHLAIALGATAAIAALSFAIVPSAWADWIGVLVASAGKTPATWAAIGVPLVLRLLVAVAIVAWGARTNRRWTVPVAAMVALPAVWFGSLSMLLAVIPLRGNGTDRAGSPATTEVPDRLRRGPLAPVGSRSA